MENLSVQLTPQMLVLVPVVAAILQFAKQIPQLVNYKAWFPLASVALGIGGAYLQNIDNPIMAGVMIGLVASGAYDVLKGKGVDDGP